MTLSRWLYIALGVSGLFLVYLFQDYLDFHSVFFKGKLPQKLDYATSYSDTKTFPFVVNKVGRYLFNDLFSISIIYGILAKKNTPASPCTLCFLGCCFYCRFIFGYTWRSLRVFRP